MDSEFRPLDTPERELLEKLLEVEFPGRDELRVQLGSVTAKQIHEDGTLKLRCHSGCPAPCFSLVAEGEYTDADGGMMTVMLHVDRRGFMWLLEIIRYDGSPIIRPPSARDLTLLFPEGRGCKPGN
jgi:hypothetical protein